MRPPETEDERRRFAGIALVFDDSIRPIEQAGQLHLWYADHHLPGVPMSLESTPGHTVGSSTVMLEQGAGALFVGDLLHSPLQILYPDLRCSFDLRPTQARATRKRILARAAATGALILPAHFGGHSAVTVTAEADTELVVHQWADFPRKQPSR